MTKHLEKVGNHHAHPSNPPAQGISLILTSLLPKVSDLGTPNGDYFTPTSSCCVYGGICVVRIQVVVQLLLEDK